jgi:hypothetical protein
LTNILLGLIILHFAACGQAQIKTPPDAMDKFEQFKKKEKFVAEQFYTGVADTNMRPLLTDKINQAADDFATLAKSGSATDKDYQDKIKIGLDRFADIYINLDTEDRERLCTYFEELMDIVGLESSGGHLNKFMYGFDPTAK